MFTGRKCAQCFIMLMTRTLSMLILMMSYDHLLVMEWTHGEGKLSLKPLKKFNEK